MNDILYNVVVLLDNVQNISITKYFEKENNDNINNLQLPNINKKYLPQTSPTKLIKKRNHSTPNIPFSPKKIPLTSPTKLKKKRNYSVPFSPKKNPLASPTKIIYNSPKKKQTNKYNKNIFNFTTFDLFGANNNLLKKNIISKDGIIIVIEKINKKTKNIITDILNINYNKPILILYDTTNSIIKNKKNNKKVNYFNIGHKLKEDLTINYNKRKIDTIKYFPIISIIKNRKNDIIHINIEDDYNNPIELFIGNLLYKEVKTFSMNEYNYPDEELINNFENLKLPIRLWTHYTRIKIMHHYSIRSEYKELISKKSNLYNLWNKYLDCIGQSFTWNYEIYAFWLKILNKLKYKNRYIYKFFDFNKLCELYPFITNENYANELIKF